MAKRTARAGCGPDGARTQHAPVRFAMRFGAHLQPGWVERTRGARFKVFVADDDTAAGGGRHGGGRRGGLRADQRLHREPGARPALGILVGAPPLPRRALPELAQQGY